MPLGHDLLHHLLGLRRERSGHERRMVAHHVELLARDVGDRRPEPARVLEADRGEHLDLRGDHVGRVVAPAEPGLDHRHLHAAPRELVVRGGRESLELGHAVVLGGGPVHERRRMRHARDSGGEVGVCDRLLPHLDPFRERTQVR